MNVCDIWLFVKSREKKNVAESKSRKENLAESKHDDDDEPD